MSTRALCLISHTVLYSAFKFSGKSRSYRKHARLWTKLKHLSGSVIRTSKQIEHGASECRRLHQQPCLAQSVAKSSIESCTVPSSSLANPGPAGIAQTRASQVLYAACMMFEMLCRFIGFVLWLKTNAAVGLYVPWCHLVPWQKEAWALMLIAAIDRLQNFDALSHL